jgi:hypothetical protein
MSIADHFEHAPDAGFVRDYDSDSAQRQFKVSLVLVVVIALAATALGLLIRFDGPSRVLDGVTAPQPVPAYAGTL